MAVVGDPLLATNTWTKIDPLTGVLAPYDPSTVTVVYQSGSDDPVTLTYGVDAAVVRRGVGSYAATFTATDDGDTTAQWHAPDGDASSSQPKIVPVFAVTV